MKRISNEDLQEEVEEVEGKINFDGLYFYFAHFTAMHQYQNRIYTELF
ncbi:hypothetical protein Riv7116_4055 [Rivularia sp. PCC 7116]|nr:hypothetical protein [Rivularia sp. PCC 7116]AFY56493.1 hypothetical protein Riv7116_4055 [Rivularia sp. PCC 7116]